jgi:hypothetical protein
MTEQDPGAIEKDQVQVVSGDRHQLRRQPADPLPIVHGGSCLAQHDRHIDVASRSTLAAGAAAEEVSKRDLGQNGQHRL